MLGHTMTGVGLKCKVYPAPVQAGVFFDADEMRKYNNCPLHPQQHQRHIVRLGQLVELHELVEAVFPIGRPQHKSDFPLVSLPVGRYAIGHELFCPSAKLKGKVYHENWLHNLLISASLGVLWGTRRNGG
jgi:hypothetical protein